MSTTHRTPAPVPFDLRDPGDARAESAEHAAPAEHPRRHLTDGSPRNADPSRPRLPAWARVPITMALMMVAAFSGSLLTLLPGVSQLLNGTGTWAYLRSLALMAAFTCATYTVLAGLMARLVDRRRFRAIGLRVTPRALLGLLVAMATSIAVVIAANGIVQLLGIGRTLQVSPGAQGSLVAGILETLILAFLLQGIGEEVLFRGYLLQSLSRRPRLAVVVSALAFGAMHLVSRGGQQGALEHVYYLAIATGFAFLAALLGIVFRSVWAAIGVHGGFHVGSAVAVAMGLTADGPALWLITGGIYAGIAVLVALTIRRRRWDEVAAEGPYGR